MPENELISSQRQIVNIFLPLCCKKEKKPFAVNINEKNTILNNSLYLLKRNDMFKFKIIYKLLY